MKDKSFTRRFAPGAKSPDFEKGKVIIMSKIEKGLLFEGILSALLAVIMFYIVGISNGMYILSIPFDFMGKGLRFLSLSSSILNVIAFLLYVLFSLLPIIYMIYKTRKKEFRKVDLLLPMISIYSFYMIYQFINPGLMVSRMPAMFGDSSSIPFIKLSMAIVYYSLCIGYILLRFTGTLTNMNVIDKTNHLCVGLQKILILVSSIYTFIIGYFYTFQMFASLKKYIVTEPSSISANFTIVKFILECLPIIFTIRILLAGVVLLHTMITNHMKEEEVLAAKQVGIMGMYTVYVTVFCNIVLNVLQFILSNNLKDTWFNLNVSLVPLIIATSAMILSGYFKQTMDLNEDNEMII